MTHLSSILFYKLFPVEDPALFRLWQKTLCEKLELKGRIIVSNQGINGALGGSYKNLKLYVKESKEWEALGVITPKWSHGLNSIPFPKLSVKERNELVTFNAKDEIKIGSNGVIDGGAHVDANELHTLLSTVSEETGVAIDNLSGKEVLFFDGRNGYEYDLGRFKKSFNPNVESAKEFIPLIESGVLDEWKEKPIITYCTGGIRCELLTPLLKARGFQKVYQIDGGIIQYLQDSRNEDRLWEGSVYTFDNRKKIFDGLYEVVSSCIWCGSSCESHENCRVCDSQVIACDSCWNTYSKCQGCFEKAS